MKSLPSSNSLGFSGSVILMRMNAGLAAKRNTSEFARNLIAIGASLIVTIVLEKGGAFNFLVSSNPDSNLLSAFVAGLFFTSFLTTAPAIIALGHIANASSSIFSVALVGAVGAVIGDLIIFSIVKNKISTNVEDIIRHSKYKRFLKLMKNKVFRFVTPVIGALIIASPLPDELGLSMLGFSKISINTFVPISYVMNALGIVIIGLVAQSLV